MHDWESRVDVPSTCPQKRREGRLGSDDVRLGCHFRRRRQFQAESFWKVMKYTVDMRVGRYSGWRCRFEAKEVSLEKETSIFSEGGEKRVAGGDQEINQPYEIKKNLCTLKMTDLWAMPQTHAIHIHICIHIHIYIYMYSHIHSYVLLCVFVYVF